MSLEMFKLKKKWDQISIVTRITIWYSFFVTILVSALLLFLIIFSIKFIEQDNIKEIRKSANKIVENIHKYEEFDDGMYFLIYDMNNNIIRGNPPSSFNANTTYGNGEIREAGTQTQKYIYYDTKIDNNRWLRVISPKSIYGKELTNVILAIVIISPFMLLIIILGGYKILKRAFKPIDRMILTANSIKKSNDLSKRITLNSTNDEMYRLGSTLNNMLEHIENSFIREKQFNNDVSHELRTPVAVILAESEYGIAFGDNVEEMKESYSIIKKQAIKMKNLISQILDLSQIESDINLNIDRVNFSMLVRELVQDYNEMCKEKGIELFVDIEADITILGNKLLIERLLDNLLTNAIKYTKDKIIVSLKREFNQCSLSIEDNGIGIRKEDQNKIWDRFYQSDKSRNKSITNGIGLGLSFVKRIVEVHNGSISLISDLGKGSNFTIKFNI